MIELPEANHLANQFRQNLNGKTVAHIYPPNKAHKFCFFGGDPSTYEKMLKGQTVQGAESFGGYAELSFGDGKKLCINDGVNPRLVKEDTKPKTYQLLIEFTNGDLLSFNVAMYGGICLHDGSYENSYYQKSLQAISPFSEAFAETYQRTLEMCRPSVSAKAFLATEQRFPGLGNGVLQDILFKAHIHPRRKIHSLSSNEQETLRLCVTSVLEEMTSQGGRDTERDLLGNFGGYKTLLSKNTLLFPCPVCGGELKKEAYLGGSVYYCPNCQVL